MANLVPELANLLKSRDYQRANLPYFKRYLAESMDINKERLADYLTGGGSTGFYLVVNDENLVKQMEEMVGVRAIFAETIAAARSEFIPQCIPILNEILIEATDMQEDGAFPERFKEPLFRAVKHIPPPNITGNAPHLVTVTLPNLYDHLGGEDEYAAAFHHGALLPGIKQNGPFFEHSRVDVSVKSYNSDQLKTKEAFKRYRYWKALYEGKRTLSFRTNDETDAFGEGQSRTFPITGSWAETQQARLDAWRRVMPSGAPQWLLLEYGQPKWKPAIKTPQQYGVVTKIRAGGGARRVRVIQGTLLGGLTNSTDVKYNPTSETLGIIPGNISGAWVSALAAEWTRIITAIWNAKIQEFNKTSTAAVLDQKTARLRSPITGRFLKRATFEQLLPTRSSRNVETLIKQGGWDELESPFTNAPMAYRDFFRKQFPNEDDW